MQYETNNLSNNWITTGIKLSCKCKAFPYIMSKTTNCSKIKIHYIQYCRVLWKVIRKAKVMYYNELLSSSTKILKRLRTLLIMKLILHPIRSLLRLNLNLVTKI